MSFPSPTKEASSAPQATPMPTHPYKGTYTRSKGFCTETRFQTGSGGCVTEYQFSWEVVEKKCVSTVLKYFENLERCSDKDDVLKTSDFLELSYKSHSEMLLDDNLISNSTTEKFFNYLIKTVKPMLLSEKATKFEPFFTLEVFSDILQNLEKKRFEEKNFIPFLNARSKEIEEYLSSIEKEFETRVENAVLFIFQQDLKTITTAANTPDSLSVDDSLSNESEVVRNAMHGFFCYLRYRLAIHKASELPAQKVFSIPDKWFVEQFLNRPEIITEQEDVENRLKLTNVHKENDFEFFKTRTAFIEELLFQKVMQISSEITSNLTEKCLKKRVEPTVSTVPAEDDKKSLHETRLTNPRELLEDLSDASHSPSLEENQTPTPVQVEVFVNSFFHFMHSLFLENRREKCSKESYNVEDFSKFVEPWIEEMLFLNNCKEALILFFKQYENKIFDEIKSSIFSNLQRLFPLSRKNLQVEWSGLKSNMLKTTIAMHKSDEIFAIPCLMTKLEYLVKFFNGFYAETLKRVDPDLAYCFNQFLSHDVFAYYLKDNLNTLEHRLQIITEFEGGNPNQTSARKSHLYKLK